MNIKRTICLAALGALLAATVPASAHHALQAEYDTAKRGTFTGTLTRFALINPHARWFFDVKAPDGTILKWEVTGGGSTGSLRTLGLTRVFIVGDTYKVNYAPARNGKNLGRAVDFIFADGKVVTLFHEDPNNPNDL